MHALVTGGAGFIGSNLVDALLERGDTVAVLDNLATGREENLAGALERGARLRRVDIRDTGAVLRAFEAEEPEVVFHLAAQVDVRKSLEDPVFDAAVNVGGTIALLEAARATGVRRFVNTSTGGAIYGETDVIPTPETVPPLPVAAYGQSKACAEAYCAWAGRLYGLSTVTLRYGNVYGPRQDPHGDAGVIAIFCGRALRGERPVVFGDGLQTRDYVYVGDIVRANLLAAEAAEPGGLYNVGTEIQSTVLDVAQAVGDAAGLSDEAFAPDFQPARLGELQRSGLDVSRARDELGYRAEVGLYDGIATTFAWAREALGAGTRGQASA
jgi:UDP-glucose 4-epimerase